MKVDLNFNENESWTKLQWKLKFFGSSMLWKQPNPTNPTKVFPRKLWIMSMKDEISLGNVESTTKSQLTTTVNISEWQGSFPFWVYVLPTVLPLW